VFWGGPVQPQTGWVLFEGPADPSEEARDLGEGIAFAGSLDVLRGIAAAPPERTRVLLGYAGWGPGQLESELAQGAWLVAPVDRQTLFEVDCEDMWVHVVRSLGIEPATLVAGRGVH
jgi:putative transcriptional regulator